MSPRAEELLNEIDILDGSRDGNGRFLFSATVQTAAEAKEAKSDLILIQKKLKVIKRKSNQVKKDIRSLYTARRAEISSPVTGLLFGAKAAGRANQVEKENLRREKEQALAPYDFVNSTIDELLLEIEDAKDKFDDFIHEENAKLRESTLRKVQPSPPPLPISKEVQLYIYLNNEVKGPYTANQLLPLTEIGILRKDTLVCLEGQDNWIAYSVWESERTS